MHELEVCYEGKNRTSIIVCMYVDNEKSTYQCKT